MSDAENGKRPPAVRVEILAAQIYRQIVGSADMIPAIHEQFEDVEGETAEDRQRRWDSFVLDVHKQFSEQAFNAAAVFMAELVRRDLTTGALLHSGLPTEDTSNDSDVGAP